MPSISKHQATEITMSTSDYSKTVITHTLNERSDFLREIVGWDKRSTQQTNLIQHELWGAQQLGAIRSAMVPHHTS